MSKRTFDEIVSSLGDHLPAQDAQTVADGIHQRDARIRQLEDDAKMSKMLEGVEPWDVAYLDAHNATNGSRALVVPLSSPSLRMNRVISR